MREFLRTRLALWCSLLVLVCLPACASFNELTGPTVVPGVVASIDIPTTQTKLSVGATLALQANVLDGSRNTIVDKSVFWTSSDTAIAKVSAEGVVTGMGVGPVRIAASVQGRSAVANLTVTARTVASIQVNLPSPNILVGATLQLSSVTLGESNDILLGRFVTWESSNPLIASIDNLGLLTGLSAGLVTITAKSESRSASVGVTVLPVPVATVQLSPALDTVVVGQTTQLTAVARDSIGAPLVDRVISWSSSSSTTASVSASGLVIGNAAGVVTITGSAEGKSGTARIVVLARPVGAVIVSPAQIAINSGQTLRLTVLITDANGTLLTNRPITYQSANTSIATVAGDGTVTGVNAGTTSITVTSELKVGRADIEVTASPVATVRINTPSAEMAIGATQKLSVTLLDAAGNTLPARPITWRSGAPTVATIAADGTVTAISAGTVVLFATVDGKLASTTLDVRAITVTSVAIAPPTANMYVGDALDLGAQLRDAAGAVVAGKAVVWSSSDDKVAVVSSAGRVRALSVGAVLITASVDGVQGSSAITTSIEPVLSVTIDQTSLTVAPNGTATLTATARGRNGAALPGRVITWSSGDNSFVSVNATTGLVRGVREGSALITATSEGKTASLQVNVSPAPIATIAVTLTDPKRFVTQTTQAIADVRDANGVALTGRQLVWTSSNTNVATVNANGLVTAIAPGSADIIATGEGKTAKATVTVALVPIITINVTLAQSSRFVGQGTSATAATLDSIGGTLTGRPVVWASSAPSVATVTQSGVISTLAPGVTNITATAEGKVGTATLTVLRVPVAKVNVTLGAAQQFLGQTTTATVQTLDADNNVLTNRTVVLTSSDVSVATVNSAGVITQVGLGQTTITAVSEGITGTAVYTVVQPPVATVTLTVPQLARFVGQMTQASVVLRDPLNRVITPQRPITYNTSDLNIATVSPTGLVTAVNPGKATITATSETIVSNAAIIDVSLIPVNSVAITVPQTSLQIGQTTQAAVTLKDVNGVTLTGRAVTWRSSDPNLVTVSSTGLITAVAVGNVIVTATSEGVSSTVPISVTVVPVSSITVSVDKSLIYIGYTAQLSSVTRDVNNNVLQGRLTTWTSSDPNIATVNAVGLVTGIAKGVVTLTGSSEGVAATTQLTVDLAPVEFVTVSVPTTQMLTGQALQATAAVSDINNRPLSGRVIVFSSSNTNVATVNPTTGAVTALNSGATNIIATSEGKMGFVTITVQNVPVATVNVSLGNVGSVTVGGTAQATVDLRDANNNVLTGRMVLWTSNDPAIATVDNNGLITGVAPGTTSISASSEGKTGQTNIVVTIAPVASVVVTLTPSHVLPAGAAQASVVLRDAANHVLSNRVVTWQSSNSAVALINPSTGAIVGLLPGTSTITATSENVSGTATFTVDLFPVVTVDVALSPTTVIAGATSQATATPRDLLGGALTGRVVTWSTSNSSIATVDANGLVTSITAGVVDIIAASEGRSGSATLTVTAPPPAPVATVNVSVNPTSVVAGGTSQASASTLDANNNVLAGRAIVWSTSDASIATVDANGLVTTIKDGTVTITATSEGKMGSAQLTVTLVPVANVTVSLGATSVAVGATTQATAVATDAGGATINGRTVTWSSSDANIATVSATGVVSGVAQGSATITATIDGKTGNAVVTVP